MTIEARSSTTGTPDCPQDVARLLAAAQVLGEAGRALAEAAEIDDPPHAGRCAAAAPKIRAASRSRAAKSSPAPIEWTGSRRRRRRRAPRDGRGVERVARRRSRSTARPGDRAPRAAGRSSGGPRLAARARREAVRRRSRSRRSGGCDAQRDRISRRPVRGAGVEIRLGSSRAARPAPPPDDELPDVRLPARGRVARRRGGGRGGGGERGRAPESVRPAHPGLPGSGGLRAARLRTGLAGRRLDAVVGVDEDSVVAAAAISARLGLPHNPVEAVAAARHKSRLRRAARAGRSALARPPRVHARRGSGGDRATRSRIRASSSRPSLPGSRGVIRADDPAAVPGRVASDRGASSRRRRSRAAAGRRAREILVEDFVAGVEVALEGLLTAGAAAMLAIFDKPDPLDGPYLRGDDLRDAVAAARRRRRRPSATAAERGRAGARVCVEGPDARGAALERRGAVDRSSSPRGRSAGSARGRCASGRECRSRS